MERLGQAQFYLRCIIAPGAFSGEYCYTVKLFNGGEHHDVAPTHYFLDQEGQTIDALAEEVEGFVQCLVQKSESDESALFAWVPTIQQHVCLFVDKSQCRLFMDEDVYNEVMQARSEYKYVGVPSEDL